MGDQSLLINFLILVATIIAIITFVITNLWNAYKMKKRYMPLPSGNDDYRLNSEARECMTKRKEAEEIIIRVLRRMEKRMALGNLVMRRLIDVNDKVSRDEIELIEKDLGIGIEDRNFGIPG